MIAMPPLRMMSYNIRYDNPEDTGSEDWANRRDKVASMMRFHGAHVTGTQEGKLHQLTQLEEQLPGYEWVGVGRQGGDGEYSAIFYETNRLELLEHATFWLSETPTEPGRRSWNAVAPRIATWGRFRDRTTEDTVLVLNTHLDNESAEARRKSAQMIAESVASLVDEEPAVVMGDLNATENSAPYRALINSGSGPSLSLRDAMYISDQSHHGPFSTFNHFEPSVRANQRIDYIFVSSGIQVDRHGHLSARWDGQYPSDHLPVLVELTLHSRPLSSQE